MTKPTAFFLATCFALTPLPGWGGATREFPKEIQAFRGRIENQIKTLRGEKTSLEETLTRNQAKMNTISLPKEISTASRLQESLERDQVRLAALAERIPVLEGLLDLSELTIPLRIKGTVNLQAGPDWIALPEDRPIERQEILHTDDESALELVNEKGLHIALFSKSSLIPHPNPGTPFQLTTGKVRVWQEKGSEGQALQWETPSARIQVWPQAQKGLAFELEVDAEKLTHLVLNEGQVVVQARPEAIDDDHLGRWWKNQELKNFDLPDKSRALVGANTRFEKQNAPAGVSLFRLVKGSLYVSSSLGTAPATSSPTFFQAAHVTALPKGAQFEVSAPNSEEAEWIVLEGIMEIHTGQAVFSPRPAELHP